MPDKFETNDQAIEMDSRRLELMRSQEYQSLTDAMANESSNLRTVIHNEDFFKAKTEFLKSLEELTALRERNSELFK